MSHEQQPPAGARFEQQVAYLSALAITKAKLFTARFALSILESISDEANELAAVPSAAIPEQRPPAHDSLAKTSEQAQRTLADCASIFDNAINFELTGQSTVLGLNRGDLLTSQFVGMKAQDGNTLYLHRPTVEHQASSDFPYWLSHVTAGIDAGNDEPVFYTRDYGIDGLGNLQRREQINKDTVVYRSLPEAEAQPLRDVLTEGKFFLLLAAPAPAKNL